MYLFSRSRRLDPRHTRRGMAYAVEMASKATQTTGLEVSCWSEVFGPGIGSLSWTTFVPDLTALEQGMDKLAVDEEYWAAIEQGAELFVGFAEDRLLQVVHGEPDPDRRPSYVSVVRASIANGHMADGIGFGVEIAQKATAVTGHATAFVTAATGGYADVAWLTGFDDLAAGEAAQAQLRADADWVQMIDSKAGEFYLPGAQQLMYRRLA